MFRRRSFVALLATSLLLFAMHADAQSNKASIAVAFTEKLAAGNVAESFGFFDATMKAGLDEPKLKLVWSQLISTFGGYKRHLAPKVQSAGGAATVVLVPVVFASKTMDFKIVFANNSDKIGGFFVVPHVEDYKEPPYSNAASFHDEPTKVGMGKWQLDGTVSVPPGTGPFPAIILVHGSGSNDQDESVGPNKPFRDLAHGLASKGILVLRYNKRTLQHAAQLASKMPTDFTIKDEALDDVVEATKVLRARADVDKKNIFVLGHSQGGTLLPRIAANDGGLRGLISLAGGNTPLEDAIINQTAYISSLGGGDASAEKKLKESALQIKALKDTDAAKDVVVFGAHPAYWLDLRKHDPLVEIKSVKIPMLFLQGGRDYQVTADGDFANWKKALQDSSQLATFKLYPNLNHLFIGGIGMATPQEYETKVGNVDARVVEDIAGWIVDLAKPTPPTP